MLLYVYKYVDKKGSAAMLAIRGQQESHQRCIVGIHCMQARKHASKETQGSHKQNFKTVVSVSPQKY